ncbi:MAG: hypothetical protein NT079_02670 [Candidatus Omnitrophica bacterium]|nr:hypothetical protein [Candidatus Omnitrophota bacterium]
MNYYNDQIFELQHQYHSLFPDKKLSIGVFRGSYSPSPETAFLIARKLNEIADAREEVRRVLKDVEMQFIGAEEYKKLEIEKDSFTIHGDDQSLLPRILPSRDGRYVVEIKPGYGVRKVLGKDKRVVFVSRGHAICTSYIVKGLDAQNQEVLIQWHAAYKPLEDGGFLAEQIKDLHDVQVVISPGWDANPYEAFAAEIQEQLGAHVKNVFVFWRKLALTSLSSDEGVAFRQHSQAVNVNFAALTWGDLEKLGTGTFDLQKVMEDQAALAGSILINANKGPMSSTLMQKNEAFKALMAIRIPAAEALLTKNFGLWMKEFLGDDTRPQKTFWGSRGFLAFVREKLKGELKSKLPEGSDTLVTDTEFESLIKISRGNIGKGLKDKFKSNYIDPTSAKNISDKFLSNKKDLANFLIISDKNSGLIYAAKNILKKEFDQLINDFIALKIKENKTFFDKPNKGFFWGSNGFVSFVKEKLEEKLNGGLDERNKIELTSEVLGPLFGYAPLTVLRGLKDVFEEKFANNSGTIIKEYGLEGKTAENFCLIAGEVSTKDKIQNFVDDLETPAKLYTYEELSKALDIPEGNLRSYKTLIKTIFAAANKGRGLLEGGFVLDVRKELSLKEIRAGLDNLEKYFTEHKEIAPRVVSVSEASRLTKIPRSTIWSNQIHPSQTKTYQELIQQRLERVNKARGIAKNNPERFRLVVTEYSFIDIEAACEIVKENLPASDIPVGPVTIANIAELTKDEKEVLWGERRSCEEVLQGNQKYQAAIQKALEELNRDLKIPANAKERYWLSVEEKLMPQEIQERLIVYAIYLLAKDVPSKEKPIRVTFTDIEKVTTKRNAPVSRNTLRLSSEHVRYLHNMIAQVNKAKRSRGQFSSGGGYVLSPDSKDSDRAFTDTPDKSGPFVMSEMERSFIAAVGTATKESLRESLKVRVARYMLKEQKKFGKMVNAFVAKKLAGDSKFFNESRKGHFIGEGHFGDFVRRELDKEIKVLFGENLKREELGELFEDGDRMIFFDFSGFANPVPMENRQRLWLIDQYLKGADEATLANFNLIAGVASSLQLTKAERRILDERYGKKNVDMALEVPWKECVQGPTELLKTINQRNYLKNQKDVRIGFLKLLAVMISMDGKKPGIQSLHDFEEKLRDLHITLVKGADRKTFYFDRFDSADDPMAYIEQHPEYEPMFDNIAGSFQDEFIASNRDVVVELNNKTAKERRRLLFQDLNNFVSSEKNQAKAMEIMKEFYLHAMGRVSPSPQVPGSLIFFRVNNSFFFNMVNAMRRLHGLSGMPHGRLDVDIRQFPEDAGVTIDKFFNKNLIFYLGKRSRGYSEPVSRKAWRKRDQQLTLFRSFKALRTNFGGMRRGRSGRRSKKFLPIKTLTARLNSSVFLYAKILASKAFP